MVIQDIRISRGEVWWVDFGEPVGSEPGYRRPAVVLQSNYFNHSALNTFVVVSVTSNLFRAGSPGNVLVSKRKSGLSKDSVVNVTQLATIDKSRLLEKCGQLDPDSLGRVAEGVRQVLDL
jgi:mRNA interferase MazF